jgi:hypothetical protein
MSNLIQYVVPALAPRLAVDLRTAARLTSISERTLRRLTATGALASKKIGARRVIAVCDLEDLVR